MHPLPTLHKILCQELFRNLSANAYRGSKSLLFRQLFDLSHCNIPIANLTIDLHTYLLIFQLWRIKNNNSKNPKDSINRVIIISNTIRISILLHFECSKQTYILWTPLNHSSLSLLDMDAVAKIGSSIGDQFPCSSFWRDQ